MTQLFKGSLRAALASLTAPYVIATRDDCEGYEVHPPAEAQVTPDFGRFYDRFAQAERALTKQALKNGHSTTRKYLFVPADFTVQDDHIERYHACIEVTPALLSNLEYLLEMKEWHRLAEMRQHVENLHWDGHEQDGECRYHHLVVGDQIRWASGRRSSPDQTWEAITKPVTVQQLVDVLNHPDREVFMCGDDAVEQIANGYVLATVDLPPEVYALKDPLEQLRAVIDLREARKEGRAAPVLSLEEKKRVMLDTWKVADESYVGVGYRVIARSIWGQMYGFMYGKICRVDPNRPTSWECSPEEAEEVLNHSANGFLEFGVWRRYVSSRHQVNPIRVLHPAARCWVPWDFKFVLP